MLPRKDALKEKPRLGKIASGSITAPKIAEGQVNAQKIRDIVVSTTVPGDGQVIGYSSLTGQYQPISIASVPQDPEGGAASLIIRMGIGTEPQANTLLRIGYPAADPVIVNQLRFSGVKIASGGSQAANFINFDTYFNAGGFTGHSMRSMAINMNAQGSGGFDEVNAFRCVNTIDATVGTASWLAFPHDSASQTGGQNVTHFAAVDIGDFESSVGVSNSYGIRIGNRGGLDASQFGIGPTGGGGMSRPFSQENTTAEIDPSTKNFYNVFAANTTVGQNVKPAALLDVGGSQAIAANTSARVQRVAGTLVEAGSGTHALFAGLEVTAPTITAGAAALTDAATVYISNEPSGATTNYALWVDAGLTRLDGTLRMGTASAIIEDSTGIDRIVFASVATSSPTTISTLPTSVRINDRLRVGGAPTTIAASGRLQVATWPNLGAASSTMIQVPIDGTQTATGTFRMGFAFGGTYDIAGFNLDSPNNSFVGVRSGLAMIDSAGGGLITQFSSFSAGITPGQFGTPIAVTDGAFYYAENFIGGDPGSTFGTWRGFWARDQGGGGGGTGTPYDGVITVASVAVDIDAQTRVGGTTHDVIGLRVGLAATYALQLSDTGGTAAGGITFGTDTNLYRSAANTLKTDDKLLVTGELEVDGALNHDGTTIGFYGVAPVARSAAYTPSNVTTDRSYNANATTIDELADVLGTLIADLQLTGIIG